MLRIVRRDLAVPEDRRRGVEGCDGDGAVRKRERGPVVGNGEADRPLVSGSAVSSRHGTPTAVSSRSAAGSAASSSSTRRSRFRNSKRRKISLSCERSGGASTSAAGSTSSGRSRRIVASSLDAPRLVGVLADRLPARGREVVRVLDHVLERAVLREELPSGLVPDPRDAGDVVRRVALEADEVRDELRADPVARLDPLRRVDVHVRDAARRHHQAHVLRDELEGVAVGRDHRRLHPRFVRARREGGDHVVGLPALELEVAVAERLDDRPEVRELLAQEIRHRPPVDLVLGRHLRPVHGTRVPCDRDAPRPVVGEELEEHVREAEQRVRDEPLGRRELLGQREERPVGEVVAVHEEELGVAGGPVVELELGPGQRLRHGPTLRSGRAAQEDEEGSAKPSYAMPRYAFWTSSFFDSRSAWSVRAMTPVSMT